MIQTKSLALLGALTLQSADAASYTVYSNVAEVGGSYLNFDVSKFNSSLGTLTGVQVSVVQSELVGAANVTNNALTQTAVGTFRSDYVVKGITSGLGYTQSGGTIYDVVTTPDWNSTTINPSATRTFAVDAGQGFSIASQNIASQSFSTYSSVGGSGVVQFAAKNTPVIATTGGSYTVDSSAVKVATKFAVTYTYTAAAPVPETSSGMLAAAAFSGLVLLRRREKPGSGV